MGLDVIGQIPRALVFEVGYHSRKKIHIIRVAFQDQAMYARTLFRGTKTPKSDKKGCVLGHGYKFWKGHDGQNKKKTCKNAFLGSIFTPRKYVLGACFKCPFTSMISSLKIQVPPPLGGEIHVRTKIFWTNQYWTKMILDEVLFFPKVLYTQINRQQHELRVIVLYFSFRSPTYCKQMNI